MACNCKTTRITCPAGIWGYDNLIGAKVEIKSTTIGNFDKIAVDGEYKIKDIYFRVSIDGKVITLVELDGLPGDYFTFKDLEILNVVNNPQPKPGDGLIIGKDIVL